LAAEKAAHSGVLALPPQRCCPSKNLRMPPRACLAASFPQVDIGHTTAGVRSVADRRARPARRPFGQVEPVRLAERLDDARIRVAREEDVLVDVAADGD